MQIHNVGEFSFMFSWDCDLVPVMRFSVVVNQVLMSENGCFFLVLGSVRRKWKEKMV